MTVEEKHRKNFRKSILTTIEEKHGKSMEIE